MTNAELLALFTAMKALHKNKLEKDLEDVFDTTILGIKGKMTLEKPKKNENETE